MSSIEDIERAVRDLKIERDTSKTVAFQYKEAFEAQTSRLRELHDLHLALQADFENEKTQHERLLAISHRGKTKLHSVDDALDSTQSENFGTAVIFSPRKDGAHQDRNSLDHSVDPMLRRIQHLISQRNYGMALAELDRLLRGSLSPKARVEGLLLKSDILRVLGPEELYNALAACSEALELCGRLSELNSFMARLQYQKGMIYYELHMLPQARDAFGTIDQDDSLHTNANEYRRSCDVELDYLHTASRRSGFDENRSLSEVYLAQLENKSNVSCDWKHWVNNRSNKH